MLRVEVENLGPIAEGSVDLKPLTVFIGKNNIGKSYMAMFIYAALRTARVGYAGRPPYGLIENSLRRFYLDSDAFVPNFVFSEAFDRKATKKDSIAERMSSIDLQRLREKVGENMGAMAESFAKSLALELQRCFSTNVSSLKCRRDHDDGSSISLTAPRLHMKFACSGATLKALPPEAQISDDLLQRSIEKSTKQLEGLRVKDKEVPAAILSLSATEVPANLFKTLWIRPHYLPAARSGILQSHKALASYIVSRSPLAGIEDMEIPKFSGVIADFLSSLLRLERRKPGKLNVLAKYLEQDLTKGEIEIRVDEHHYPEIFYRTTAGKFALHRTSSMVSELAPIILYLRHIVEPGDLLIIEEPEAHLHPENQRKIARALVGLVRAGVKVVITTHSDYLLDQLSNYVRRGQLSPEERLAEADGQEDYLGTNDIGVYLFRFDESKGGTVVDTIKVTAEEGIAEEEFRKVGEELYEETYQLRRRLLARN